MAVDIVPGRKKLDFPRRMVLLSNKFPWNIWLVHESFGVLELLCKKYVVVVSKLFSEKFSTLTWIFCHHSKIQSMRSSSHKTIPGGLIATKILNRHKHYITQTLKGHFLFTHVFSSSLMNNFITQNYTSKNMHSAVNNIFII